MIAYKKEKAAINNGIGWREPPIPLFMAAFRRKRKFTLTLFIKLLFLLLFCVFMNKQSRADPFVDVCTGKKEGYQFYERSTNYVYVCKGGRAQKYRDTSGASCNVDKKTCKVFYPEGDKNNTGGSSSGGGSSSDGGSSGGSLEIVDIPGQKPPKKDSSGGGSFGGSSGGSSDGIGPVGGWLGDKEAEEQSKQKAREEKEKQEKEKKKGGGNVPDPSSPPGNTGGSYQGYPFGKKDLESAKRLMEALKEHQKRWADKWTAIADQANRIKSDLANELATCDWYYVYAQAEYEKCVNSKIERAAEKSKELSEQIELLKRIQAIEEKALNEQMQELNPISRLIVNAFSGFTIPDGSSSSKTTEKTGDDKNGTTKETETVTEKTSDGGGSGGGVVNNYNTQTNNITTTNNQTINNEIVNKIETRDYSGAIKSLNESLNNLNSSIQGQTASLNQNLNGGFAGLAGKLGELSEKIDKLSKGDGQAGDGKNGSGKGDGSSSGDKKGDGKAEEGYQGNPEWDKLNGMGHAEFTKGKKFSEAGYCPAPVQFNISIMGKSMSLSFSYEWICDVAKKLRPVVVAFAYCIASAVCLRGLSSS